MCRHTQPSRVILPFIPKVSIGERLESDVTHGGFEGFRESPGAINCSTALASKIAAMTFGDVRRAIPIRLSGEAQNALVEVAVILLQDDRVSLVVIPNEKLIVESRAHSVLIGDMLMYRRLS